MHYMNRPNKKVSGSNKVFVRALTFMELIVVMAIVSLIWMSIYVHMENGLKIWRKASSKSPRQELDMFLEKFTSDLRSTFKFNGIGFKGKNDRLEFPALLYSQKLRNRSVGEISYVYESGNKYLYRKKRDYSNIFDKENGLNANILRNVLSMKLLYYYYDKENKEFIWRDSSLEEVIPLAVRLELEVGDEKRQDKVTRTVLIPVGG